MKQVSGEWLVGFFIRYSPLDHSLVIKRLHLPLFKEQYHFFRFAVHYRHQSSLSNAGQEDLYRIRYSLI